MGATTTCLLALIASLLQQVQVGDALQLRELNSLRPSTRSRHLQRHTFVRNILPAPQPHPRFFSQRQQYHHQYRYISPSSSDSIQPWPSEGNVTAVEKGTGDDAFSWIPKWILNMGPKRQFVIVIALYIFHITVLAQRQVVFPMQLIPNDKGQFTGIGWDSLAGMLTLAFYYVLRRKVARTSTTTPPPPTGDLVDDSAQNNTTTTSSSSGSSDPLPCIFSTPTEAEAPWKLPKDNIRHRLTSLITAAVLVQTYFFTGKFSIFWEDMVYNLSGLGFHITAPMQRSLCVLLGHMSWLTTGTLLLKWLPRPPKFFGNNKLADATNQEQENNDDQQPRWFQSSRQSYWLWWVIGGYFVSSWLFNVADLVNHYILPQAVLDDAQESVVTQLINPEHNGLAASFVGYIAPCLTAPWWEEVLYRGFGLAGLTQLLGYKWAVFLQGVIFSAHHMSLTAALPLAVLGWTWAVLYTKSRNLWTVVLVHALWNSRVFLGSWLGL